MADSNGGPLNIHRFRHNRSILALVVTKSRVYAGTQGGDILVYDLRTYALIDQIEAHAESVLALGLSQDEALLFSSAGDRFVNVWDTTTLNHLASIYSSYDIGDIFSLAYSPKLETLYLGCQNTCIQWYNLKEYTTCPPPNPDSHPSLRHDPFFDSSGPGGVRTPRRGPESAHGFHRRTGRVLEINENHIQPSAHFGYVYCMLLAKGQQSGLLKDEVLISGGGDGVIKLWGLDEGAIQELGQLEDAKDSGESVLTIALDGTFLYSGRVNGELNVWDLETRQLLRRVNLHEHDILTLSIGYGILFVAAMDGSVTKIDQRYETIGSWKAHQGMVLASAFTTHDKQPIYVTGGNDNGISIWDVQECLKNPAITRTSHDHLVDALKQFIAFRTVSSDSTCKSDCRRAASWLRSVLKGFGASTELINADDGCNPIVYGRFRGNAETAAERKKILFYGHYDVVRAEKKKENALSLTDPFTMEGVDGYLYGRGTSDNKGPIMAAIYAVADLVSRKALESDIVFVIEGEEECGSRGFKQAIQRSKNLIGDIDWILVANSYWLNDEVPCLTYGLRGVIHATVRIQSDEPDLHSGIDGSSLLDEPLKDLVMLIARLSGRHGKVEIPGFYDAVLPVTEHEKSLYSDISRTLLERDSSLGSEETLTQSLIQRWANPSLTIHNLKNSGPQNSTIISRRAEAALSLRLVPNQEVDVIATALTEFLKAQFADMESKNHLSVKIGNQAEPWLGDYNNSLFQTLEQAIMDVWNTPNPHLSPSQLPSLPFSPKLASSDRKVSVVSKPATSSTLANSSTSPTTSSAEEPFFSSLGAAMYDGTSDVPPKSALANTKPFRPRKPLYIREGGSIPAIRFLEKEFGAQAAHLPCGQASDNAHLDNERIRVLNLFNSKEIFRRVFEGLPRK